jgi:hypothetical protein
MLTGRISLANSPILKEFLSVFNLLQIGFCRFLFFSYTIRLPRTGAQEPKIEAADNTIKRLPGTVFS